MVFGIPANIAVMWVSISSIQQSQTETLLLLNLATSGINIQSHIGQTDLDLLTLVICFLTVLQSHTDITVKMSITARELYCKVMNCGITIFFTAALLMIRIVV